MRICSIIRIGCDNSESVVYSLLSHRLSFFLISIYDTHRHPELDCVCKPDPLLEVAAIDDVGICIEHRCTSLCKSVHRCCEFLKANVIDIFLRIIFSDKRSVQTDLGIWKRTIDVTKLHKCSHIDNLRYGCGDRVICRACELDISSIYSRNDLLESICGPFVIRIICRCLCLPSLLLCEVASQSASAKDVHELELVLLRWNIVSEHSLECSLDEVVVCDNMLIGSLIWVCVDLLVTCYTACCACSGESDAYYI